MAVTDRKLHRYTMAARHVIAMDLGNVPISQAGVVYSAFQPGLGYLAGEPPYLMSGYDVVAVQLFCTATAATAAVDVQIMTDAAGVLSAGATILTGTMAPVAGQIVTGALLSGAAKRLSFAQALAIVVTTNGAGTITNPSVFVTIRPYPLDNEAA